MAHRDVYHFNLAKSELAIGTQVDLTLATHYELFDNAVKLKPGLIYIFIDPANAN